ncbi:type IV toxin-antitoxin system AbiEi family antitoxin domain-containing protein [Gordonia terrae]|uniref:type IV toxin-antitoxin system AbiEi family antitoxin domain-containing protein n=1 Tax=Gordonia terrae TaxID=2055 RepID=UPI003F6BF719
MADNHVLRRSTLATLLGEDEIRLRQERGALRSVWRGALHLGPIPDDELERYRLRIRGAATVGGSGRVVSHESAAALHGIPLLRPDTTTVHFTTPNTGRSGGSVHLHRGNLPPEHVTEIGDVRVTTPARTVADVARLGTFEQAVCCLDSGLRSGITHAEIDAVVASSTKLKGVRHLRQAFAVADGRSESVGESLSRATMIAAGLPLPDLQVTIVDSAGRFIARGDFGWADKVIGEFDGKVKYSGQFGASASETVFDEKRREDAIRRTGRIVVRWTWQDLLEPRHFRSLIQAALHDAGLV